MITMYYLLWSLLVYRLATFDRFGNILFYSILLYLDSKNICTFDFEEWILIYHKKLDQIASHNENRTYISDKRRCLWVAFFLETTYSIICLFIKLYIPQHTHHIFIHHTAKYLNLLQIERKTNLGCFLFSNNFNIEYVT